MGPRRRSTATTNTAVIEQRAHTNYFMPQKKLGAILDYTESAPGVRTRVPRELEFVLRMHAS